MELSLSSKKSSDLSVLVSEKMNMKKKLGEKSNKGFRTKYTMSDMYDNYHNTPRERDISSKTKTSKGKL